MCFPVNFEKFLRAPFFIEHLRWLILSVGKSIIKVNKQDTRIYLRNGSSENFLESVGKRVRFL